jgi:hypothetical protein
MKVGIAVVYLVHQRDEALLDLHLRQIERHTDVPYTIYGSVNRLLPELRAKLEQRPDFRACPCPDSDRRDHFEHSSQLERLVECAVDDGATHVVVLHVDSFPVRSGWIRALTEKLSGSCALSAVMRHRLYDQKPSTICLCFPRGFYLEHRPRFLISMAERTLPAYRQYTQAHEINEDSGSGFGFKLFCEGLGWHPLLDTRDGEARNGIGSVYGDLVFHLGGAVRYGNRRAGGTARGLGFGALQPLKETVKPLLPRPLRRLLTVRARRSVADAINSRTYERMRSRLLEAPEAVLQELRAERSPVRLTADDSSRRA